MKKLFRNRILLLILLSASASAKTSAQPVSKPREMLTIGWASTNITPELPAALGGTNSARIAEEVMDPLTATALAIEGADPKVSDRSVILISCDLRRITDPLRDGVREFLKKTLPEVPSEAIILNATHSHNAPPLAYYGIDLGGKEEKDYVALAIPRIAAAAEAAWKNRKPGGISFGLAHAVVGHNRMITDIDGVSKMYGKTDTPRFDHAEGYEDPSINILYTWSPEKELTGLVVNVSIPSQVSTNVPKVSADYWHEARLALRARFGEKLFILPQCGSAGDQSPKVLIDKKAEARMERLTGMNRRQMIGTRIAEAVNSIFPVMKENIAWNPILSHRAEILPLPRRLISEKDVEEVLKESAAAKERYEAALKEIEQNPDIKQKPDWSKAVTVAYSLMNHGPTVKDRFELQKKEPRVHAELHILRIGDMVMAMNPYELYVDFGLQIKARSLAEQTFIVQLAGNGTYIPTLRAVAGGGYGATPRSTDVGPEGGTELVNWTVDAINQMWQLPAPSKAATSAP